MEVVYRATVELRKDSDILLISGKKRKSSKNLDIADMLL